MFYFILMTAYTDCIFFYTYKEIIKSFYNISVTSIFSTHAYIPLTFIKEYFSWFFFFIIFVIIIFA